MKYTTDHEEIRKWIEEHKGTPAVIKGMIEETGVEIPEMLHVSFDQDDPNMEGLDWEEFFERFEDANLALVYNETIGEGETPDFEFADRDAAREEYFPESTMPDTGDADELHANTVPDSNEE